MSLSGLFLFVFPNSSESYSDWMVSFPVNIKSCQSRAAVMMRLRQVAPNQQRHNYVSRQSLVLKLYLIWDKRLRAGKLKVIFEDVRQNLWVKYPQTDDDWGILTCYAGHTSRSVGPPSSNTLHRSRTAHMTRWELGWPESTWKGQGQRAVWHTSTTEIARQGNWKSWVGTPKPKSWLNFRNLLMLLKHTG